MDIENKNTLGGFEAILDSFIPNNEESLKETKIDSKSTSIDESNNDDLDIEDIKKLNDDPITKKVKKAAEVEKETEEETEQKTEEEVEELETKRKSGRPKKEDKEKEDGDLDGNIYSDDTENNIVTNFFDAIAEKLSWDFEEGEEKPKNVDELIEYFQNVIEENSKPEYSSKEVEELDNFVKQGGDLKKYLTIDAELDLDDIDIEDESNQKLIVKQLLKEKGFSDKKINKLVDRYEEAGLLEDEAQDALEDLKEIKEEKKKQLLEQQKKVHEQYIERQQQFYDNVVSEIKGLKNIRGITVPEKDKKVLIDYILKPDTDGKTKYQKDYAKGGVKNLIESAYFTMNADKLIEAAKREGNNSAIDKFRRSLKSSSITTKSKRQSMSSDDDPIWLSAARQLRIS